MRSGTGKSKVNWPDEDAGGKPAIATREDKSRPGSPRRALSLLVRSKSSPTDALGGASDTRQGRVLGSVGLERPRSEGSFLRYVRHMS